MIDNPLADLRGSAEYGTDVEQSSHRYLDAVGTLVDTDMTQDDLIEVAIRLAWRLAAAEELRSDRE